jgi:hypothetical protein
MTGGIRELARTQTHDRSGNFQRQRVARALPEAEHVLRRNQLAVDGGIGGLLRLPVSGIGEDPFCRDRLSPPPSEEAPSAGRWRLRPGREISPLARYSRSAGWRGRRRVHELHAILKRVVRKRVDPNHGHRRVHHVLPRGIVPTGTRKVNEPYALDVATEPLLATSGLHAPYCGLPVSRRISFQGLAQ